METVNTPALYEAPNPKEKINMNGITPAEGDDINSTYTPFLQRLQNQSALSIKIDFANPTDMDMKIARDLRLAVVKVRTDCEKEKNNRKRIHQLKADIEQCAYNLVASDCKALEERLAPIEKAQEIKEKARKEALKAERLKLLAEFNFDAGQVKVEDLNEDAFEMLINGLKQKQKEAAEALAKQEEERLAGERRTKLQSERKDALMNLGARIHGDVLGLELKKEDGGAATAIISDLGIMSEELFDRSLKEFQYVCAKNSEHEAKIEAENERLILEQEEAGKKQERYNARVAKLVAVGGIVQPEDVRITDGVKNQSFEFHIKDIMIYSDEEFYEWLNDFTIANNNNKHQIEESRKEAQRLEENYKTRLSQLTNLGAKVLTDKIELIAITGTKNASVFIAQLKAVGDEAFKLILGDFNSVKLENDRQLDIEKEAEKVQEMQRAEEEIRAKEHQDELERIRKSQLLPDKEKLIKFSEALLALEKPELKSKEANNILGAINEMTNKMVAYINQKTAEL